MDYKFGVKGGYGVKTEEITVKKIIADEGMVLTDGNDYGKIIFLAEGQTADIFTEITEEEYQQKLAEEEARMEAEREAI